MDNANTKTAEAARAPLTADDAGLLVIFPDVADGEPYALKKQVALGFARRGIAQITDETCVLRGRVYARLTPIGHELLLAARRAGAAR